MNGNYEKLKALLRELFQLDRSDLDFGIYRIMNQKHDEIVRFLDEDLLPQVQAAFKESQAGSRASVEAELQDAVEQAKKLGVDPDSVPRVKELRAKYGEAVDVTALENEVFSDLYNFFGRYYDEGDFLSLRRYKEGVYAIPYEGEEVKLHWANHDQYYIKSSEYLRDYAFRVPGGKRVHFKVVEADVEKDNVKTEAGKERRFLLAADDPVAEQDGDLFIRFVHQPDPSKRRQDAINRETTETVLGTGKMAEALAPAIRAVSKEWLVALSTSAPTGTNPNRTLLEKHLTDYTAKFTFDYFIHKDLGKFLRRELDFFIKNEVLHIDDIEDETAQRVEQKVLNKIKAIRRIALKIVQFLGKLEDFQKRLWLKKKFVVETNYCITLDRVPEAVYPDVAANDAQREEWVRLFAIDEINADLGRQGYSTPLTVPFLKENPFLTLDTRFFGQEFKDKLLAGVEDYDGQCDGWLVQGENSQALGLFGEQYKDSLRCVYMDPPYNTDAGPILYKNGYRSSSWVAMMEDRLKKAKPLLAADGVICVTIDDYQVHELAYLLDEVFDRSNQLGVAVIRNNPSGRSTVRGFSICHEYAFFYRKTEAATLARLPRTEKQLDRFTQENGVHVDWRNFRKDGGAVTHRAARPKQFYPIYVRPDGGALRIPEMSWDNKKRQWDILEKPEKGETVVWPKDEKGKERVWSLNHISARENLQDLEVRTGKSGDIQIYRRHIPADGVLPRSWWDKNTYAAREYGSATLADLFGESSAFSFAKSPFAVQDCIWVAGLNAESDGWVLDPFAGSGTTGHAVINLNREDGGTRKYVLVEMGDYFDTVLKPRIQKAVYSKDWKDGKPVSREGSSHMFKYIRLESYEDALNNLELKRTPEQDDLLRKHSDLRESYTLSYMLDVESRDSLLNIRRFDDPFNYRLNIATANVGESKPVTVDLVETFNYLIGLTVKHVDTIRGVKVVEGKNPQGDRVLVLWRKVAEMDNDKLDKWFQRQGYNTQDMEYDLVYVNGDNNLENLRRPDQTWKVRLIEEEFLRLMFECKDV